MQLRKRQKQTRGAITITTSGATKHSSTVTVLSHLFHQPSPISALSFLTTNLTKTQRKRLASLAGISMDWQQCDQSVPSNVTDLSNHIVEELWKPYTFYRESLLRSPSPRETFESRLVSRGMERSSGGFWTCQGGSDLHRWLPEAASTFDAVVHFVQAGSGTGVCVGDGAVLTCAHVVGAWDDDDGDSGGSNGGAKRPPNRTGRNKVVMLPSGRTFLTECTATLENTDGTIDVAVLKLQHEIPILDGLPTSTSERKEDHRRGVVRAIPINPTTTTDLHNLTPLPNASLSPKGTERNDQLFCIGNPSSIDLESIAPGAVIDFDPPTWHGSVGVCLGSDVSPSSSLSSSTSRSKRAKKMEGTKKKEEELEECHYLGHSCWTYWGHSGAPLFDKGGNVVGLHCAWDDTNGVRFGQKIGNLWAVMRKARLVGSVHEVVAKTDVGDGCNQKVEGKVTNDIGLIKEDVGGEERKSKRVFRPRK